MPTTLSESSSAQGSDARKVIFTYSLSHLPQSKKVSFFYMLKGRYGKPGVLKRCEVQQLAKGALLVPIAHADTIESFLKQWGCEYAKATVMMAA